MLLPAAPATSMSRSQANCCTRSTRPRKCRPGSGCCRSRWSTRRRNFGAWRTDPMKKKVESLTSAQTTLFPEYIKRWTDIGLSTLPADRGAAEDAIGEMYRAGGLEPPKKIVWWGSPLFSGLTRAIVLHKKLLADIGKSVGDSVWASVWASVRDSV